MITLEVLDIAQTTQTSLLVVDMYVRMLLYIPGRPAFLSNAHIFGVGVLGLKIFYCVIPAYCLSNKQTQNKP